jgi:hypothetical protein
MTLLSRIFFGDFDFLIFCLKGLGEYGSIFFRPGLIVFLKKRERLRAVQIDSAVSSLTTPQCLELAVSPTLLVFIEILIYLITAGVNDTAGCRLRARASCETVPLKNKKTSSFARI